MKIYYNVLNEILQRVPSAPPETGGIIGGKDERICLWEYDRGYPVKGCAYRPNVNFLNQVIAEWLDKGYDFMGIFHVHFGGSKNLSDGDKRYIEEIMNVMPGNITQLYFPIVLQPDRQMVSYVACKDLTDDIAIMRDELEVLAQTNMPFV